MMFVGAPLQTERSLAKKNSGLFLVLLKLEIFAAIGKTDIPFSEHRKFR